MERLKLTLDEREYRALAALADRELRPIPDQARAIIRERLHQAGFLAFAGSPSAVPGEAAQ